MIAFNHFVDQAEAKLDEVVVSGSDDELFIASYLHGHFSLAVSQVLQSDNICLNILNDVLLSNLNDAFANKELEQRDQHKVFTLWSDIKN
ncbi:YfcL family protein [Aliiglaciecola sp. M165]|uniref:YfcL family protein n=1 Tax=Aliiglaciecola sp. M165 TaxID=2593649 RepID=UPI00117EE30A|nr:YfcL family protein [Aliiglaciecola sp. M165]TRY29624.1 YfcL family protein [Aliiglaciecola sp. M165]